MGNCERVCGAIARILIRAGFAIDTKKDYNAVHEQILTALSDYEDKYNEMLEYILNAKK